MAVDTRNKRASVIGIAAATLLTLPLADGAVGTADRPHVAYSYAGIMASSPVPIPDQTWAVSVLVTSPSNAVDVQCSAVSSAESVDVGAPSAVTQVKVS